MRTLLIDADDTLWESNIYYQRCSANLEDWLVSLGITRADVAPSIARYEQLALLTFGYSPHGFIEALVMTTRELAERYAIPLSDQLLEQARSFGAPMLHPPIVLLPQVESTLRLLAVANQLILVTKGDKTLQERKLERSGIQAYFSQVYVLAEKDAASYRLLIEQERLDPEGTFMVGNSPKSDINPALAAGLRAVYIPHPHTWSAECEEVLANERLVILPRFADLIEYFNCTGETF